MTNNLSRKPINPLAIKIALLCVALFFAFLTFMIANDKANIKENSSIYGFLFQPGIVIATAICFMFPWLMTHLAAKIISKSSGALRLAISLSVIWTAINYFFLSNKQSEKFITVEAPLFIFWVAIWIIKGFNSDKKNGGSI